MTTLDQFRGCLLGLALGDALGAPFEGGFVERLVWRVIGRTWHGEMRWTDDTQMTIDLVESFLHQQPLDPNDLAMRFAKSYRWSRGYGPAAAKVLKRIARGVDWRQANRSVYRDGSFGNGAAMRAPILGLIYADRVAELPEVVQLTAAVTHAHPIGVEGAVLLAAVTADAAQRCGSRDILQKALAQSTLPEFRTRLETACDWLGFQSSVRTPAEVANQFGHGVAAHQSCVTAIYVALRFRNQPFLEMQQFVANVGGDVDTLGAMAGAIWGTINGSSNLPATQLAKLEQHARLESLAETLYRQRNNM